MPKRAQLVLNSLVYTELRFHQDIGGHLVLRLQSHMHPSDRVLRVFSLGLLTSPDLSPGSLFSFVVQVRVHALVPHSHMGTFWYADTETQVSLVQVHPTVILTHSSSPRNSQGPAGSQHRSREASTSLG